MRRTIQTGGPYALNRRDVSQYVSIYAQFRSNRAFTRLDSGAVACSTHHLEGLGGTRHEGTYRRGKPRLVRKCIRSSKPCCLKERSTTTRFSGRQTSSTRGTAGRDRRSVGGLTSPSIGSCKRWPTVGWGVKLTYSTVVIWGGHV